MKKFILILLTACMVFSMCACTKTQEPVNSNGSNVTNSEVTSSVKDEVGIWSLCDFEGYEEQAKKEYGSEATEEDIKGMKDLFMVFFAGMYFQFNEDGTGVQDMIIPESMKDSSESERTEFKWEDGKMTMDGDANEVVPYEIVDGKLKLTDDESNLTLVFERVEKLEDISNSELFKRAEEFGASMSEMFSTESDLSETQGTEGE